MNSNSFDYSSAIVAHLVYFGIAIVATSLFVAIYVTVTPHREFKLIREGNVAAAVSLGGALLGYIIPLAKAVSQSESMMDMLLWSAVALAAQLVVYGISRLILPTLSADVSDGKVASGVFVAAMSVGIGLLNAAAMTE